MTKSADLKWLKQRDGRWHFERRVPARVAHLDKRQHVRVSCDTAILSEAIITRDRLNAAVEDYWRALSQGADPDVHERYQAAVSRARLEGFVYRPSAGLADISDGELVARLRRIGIAMDRAAEGEPPSADERQLVEVLTGALSEPPILLSEMVEHYEKLTRDQRRLLSDMQLRKWRLPLLRAVKNIIAVIGDKSITDLSRSDAISFRDWWYERIEDGLSPESANKDITHIGKMIAQISDRRDLDLKRQFRGLRFVDDGGSKRPPYSAVFTRDTLLRPGALGGLNEVARGVLLAMVNTGARPSELAGLRIEDIRLDAAIPHIAIVDYPGRVLKTKFSKRDLPLVAPRLRAQSC